MRQRTIAFPEANVTAKPKWLSSVFQGASCWNLQHTDGGKSVRHSISITYASQTDQKSKLAPGEWEYATGQTFSLRVGYSERTSGEGRRSGSELVPAGWREHRPGPRPIDQGASTEIASPW
jgi:hypothetical protein